MSQQPQINTCRMQSPWLRDAQYFDALNDTSMYTIIISLSAETVSWNCNVLNLRDERDIYINNEAGVDATSNTVVGINRRWSNISRTAQVSVILATIQGVIKQKLSTIRIYWLLSEKTNTESSVWNTGCRQTKSFIIRNQNISLPVG